MTKKIFFRHKEAWVREVDIMQRLSHPGVVACFPAPPGLDQGPAELPSLCMEFCEAGDLRWGRLLCIFPYQLELRTKPSRRFYNHY